MALSRSDFRAKIFISKKEAAETAYWLRILSRANPDTAAPPGLQKECNEIIAILQSVTKKLMPEA